MITIQIGNSVLDVDSSTKLSLTYDSGLYKSGSVQIGYSLGLSVPSTRINDNVFNLDRVPSVDGVRHGAAALVACDGMVIPGTIYLQRYSGGRYELLFLYGKLAKSKNSLFTVSLRGNLHTGMTIATTDKLMAADWCGRNSAPFAFVGYNNGVISNGRVFGSDVTTDMPANMPTIFPAVNFGWLVETACVNAGFRVVLPEYSGVADMYEYAIILDSMKHVDSAGLVSVNATGSARAGWTLNVTAAQLADLGLTMATKRYKRGAFGANVTAYVFVATRHVAIRYAAGSVQTNTHNVFCGGEGYDWLGAAPFSAAARDFELEAGEWFTVVEAADMHPGIFGDHWDLTDGYTTAVNVTFEVDDGDPQDYPLAGETVSLDDNMPDVTLAQLLQTAAALTDSVFTIDDDGVIRFYTMADIYNEIRLGDPLLISVEELPILQRGEVLRYIDGFGKVTKVDCKSADYVTEEGKYRQSYPCDNDILDDEVTLYTIPFNEGNRVLTGTGDGQYWSFRGQDVELGTNNEPSYKGKLSLIMSSSYCCPSFPGGDVQHIQTAVDFGGVGDTSRANTREAVTVRVTVRLPLAVFLKLSPDKTATWEGMTYLVRTATWSDNWCDLELVSLKV